MWHAAANFVLIWQLSSRGASVARGKDAHQMWRQEGALRSRRGPCPSPLGVGPGGACAGPASVLGGGETDLGRGLPSPPRRLHWDVRHPVPSLHVRDVESKTSRAVGYVARSPAHGDAFARHPWQQAGQGDPHPGARDVSSVKQPPCEGPTSSHSEGKNERNGQKLVLWPKRLLRSEKLIPKGIFFKDENVWLWKPLWIGFCALMNTKKSHFNCHPNSLSLHSRGRGHLRAVISLCDTARSVLRRSPARPNHLPSDRQVCLVVDIPPRGSY